MQPADCKNRGVPLISPSRGEKEGGKKKKDPITLRTSPVRENMFFAHFQSRLFFFLPCVSSAQRLCGGSLGPSRGENPDERRPSSPAHLALCRPSCNQRQRRRPLMCARRFLFPPSHRLLRLSLSLRRTSGTASETGSLPSRRRPPNPPAKSNIIDQKHCGRQFTLIWDLTRDSKGNLAFVSRVEGNIITLWHHFFLIQSKTLHPARDNLPFYYPSI